MRLFAAVAAIAVAALLYWVLTGEETGPSRPSDGRAGSPAGLPAPGDPGDGTHDPGSGTDSGLPDLRAVAEAAPREPATRAAIERFLEACRRLGPAAVPDLVRLLREGSDVAFSPRWLIRDHGVEGYPTLRSVYLAALASIDGEEATQALQDCFAATGSAGESLQAAWALAERGVKGFEAELLRRADAANGIADLTAQRAMVELAARVAPELTAEHVERGTPRGDEPGDPRALAFALSVLPVDISCRTARGLLAEPDVTQIARSRYVRALANRPELEPLRVMRAAVLADNWDEATRIDAAHALVQSTAFLEDAQKLDVARAENDPATVAELRARMEERIRLTRDWIEAALGIDLETTDDARAINLRRKLAAHEQLLQRTR